MSYGRRTIAGEGEADDRGDPSLPGRRAKEVLDDLRRRLATTRWPDRELVDDRSQSVQLATMQALAEHWADLHRPPELDRVAYPNLIHYNRLPKGGHFAAWEQPALLSEEVRTAFRTLH